MNVWIVFIENSTIIVDSVVEEVRIGRLKLRTCVKCCNG